MSCPECQRNHRKYPHKCFTIVNGEYTHLVIARAASGCVFPPLSNPEWVKETAQKYKEMSEYIKANWPGELK